MRSEHEYIPVPEEVTQRQRIIRAARDVTSELFRIRNRPFDMDAPEFAYFLEWFKH